VERNELAVGDIITVEAGDKIPADCVLVDGQGVLCNEGKYNDIDLFEVEKQAASLDVCKDCFLLTDSLVLKGHGRAVVCAVGERTRQGIFSLERLGISDEQTVLQERLENLGSHFTKFAIMSAGLILGVLILHWVFTAAIAHGADYSGLDIFIRLLDNVTVAIALVIVAVPEGLPLAIGIVLCFSAKTLREDKVLVKNVESPQMMGRVQNICCGKTSTLTTGEMEVKAFYLNTRLIPTKFKNQLVLSDFDDDFVQLVRDCIIFNSSARVELDDDAVYRPVGNPTECGLLRMLADCNMPLQDIVKLRENNILAFIPHNSTSKRQIVAVRLPDNPKTVRVVVKGAPEYLIGKCSKTFNTENKLQILTEDEQTYVLTSVIDRRFGQAGQRCILIAYKDYPIEVFERLQKDWNGFVSEEERDILVQDLTLLGLFALEDPLKKERGGGCDVCRHRKNKRQNDLGGRPEHSQIGCTADWCADRG